VKYSLPYTVGLLGYFDRKPTEFNNNISDLYFSDEKFNPSARYLPGVDSEDMWNELQRIKQDHGIEMQYVMNSSVWKNDVYTTGKQQLIDNINTVYDLGCTMLTINNMLLLRDAEFREKIPQDIKIKLSINNKVATLEEVVFLYEYNAIENFILDRSLNRDMDELNRIDKWRQNKPRVTLTLLAQEGCLTKCPWKNTCDNMITTFHQYDEHEVNDLKSLHSSHFCSIHYSNHPADMLKSPWITPGGVNLYEDVVDYMKISGRMQPVNVLGKVFEAYINKDHSVDVFDILTGHAGSGLAGKTITDLETHGYSAKVNNCKNRCQDCNFCDTIYSKLVDED